MRYVIRFSAWVAAGSLAGALLGLLVLPRLSTASSDGSAETFSPALSERLQQAGAASGDIQIALLWNDTSRLQLSCIDPTGQTLDRKTAKVASGGELDLAEKSTPPGTVANLHWPRGTAPAGRYQVLVAGEGESRAEGPTTFTVAVKAGTHVEEFSGVLRAGGASSPLYEFVYEVPRPLFLWNGLWTVLVTAGAALGLFLGQGGLPGRPGLSFRTVACGATILLAAGLIGAGSSVLRAVVAGNDWALPAVWGFSWAQLGGLLCRLAAPGLAGRRVLLCGVVSGALGFLVFQAVDEFVADPAANLWCASGQGGCLGATFALVHPTFTMRSRRRRSSRAASGFSLRLDTGRIVPLTERLRLTSSDLPGLKPRLLRRAVAQVRPKPGAAGIFGLTNLSRNGWSVTLPGGSPSKVLPGQTVRLVRGTRMGFGTTAGDIL